MRVTKKVENYIREQVKAKIMPKYEAEKAEARRILDIKNDIENRAYQAAKEAARAVYAEAKTHGELFELSEEALQRASCGCSRSRFRNQRKRRHVRFRQLRQ
jgi:hypothetical protein